MPLFHTKKIRNIILELNINQRPKGPFLNKKKAHFQAFLTVYFFQNFTNVGIWKPFFFQVLFNTFFSWYFQILFSCFRKQVHFNLLYHIFLKIKWKKPYIPYSFLYLNIVTKLRASSFDTSYFTNAKSQIYFTGCCFSCTQGRTAKIPVPIQFRENCQAHVRCLGSYVSPLPITCSS